MERREFLCLLPFTVPLSGCLTRGGSSSEDEKSSSEDSGPVRRPDFHDDIFIVVNNYRSEQVSVQITVRDDDQLIFEEEMTVSTDDSKEVYSEITDMGTYTLHASTTDQQESEFPFNIGEFDIDKGSNLIVDIGPNDLSIAIEE